MLNQEYHRLSDKRNLFLIVLEVRKSKVKKPADPVSAESPLSGLQMAIFSLCSHTVKKDRSLLCLFLQGHQSYLWGLHPHASFNSQKFPLQISLHWGCRLQNRNCEALYTFNAKLISNLVYVVPNGYDRCCFFP